MGLPGVGKHRWAVGERDIHTHLRYIIRSAAKSLPRSSPQKVSRMVDDTAEGRSYHVPYELRIGSSQDDERFRQKNGWSFSVTPTLAFLVFCSSSLIASWLPRFPRSSSSAVDTLSFSTARVSKRIPFCTLSLAASTLLNNF